MKRILISLICVCLTLASFTQIPEKVDRGVVALTVNQNSVYVGWRLHQDDPGDTGFNVYRQDICSGEHIILLKQWR